MSHHVFYSSAITCLVGSEDHLKLGPMRCSDADLLCLMWVFGQHQIQNLIIVVINKKQSFPFFMFPDETLRDSRWHLLAIVALSRAENKCLFQNLFVSLGFSVIALMPSAA